MSNGGIFMLNTKNKLTRNLHRDQSAHSCVVWSLFALSANYSAWVWSGLFTVIAILYPTRQLELAGLISSTLYLMTVPILDSSNSAKQYDVKGDKWGTIIWSSRKQCGKRRNRSIRAISSFSKMFLKAICCWCIKMSIYGVKG